MLTNKFYRVRFFTLLSILFVIMAFALLGLGVFAYIRTGVTWYIYILIIWGLYSAYSTYFLLYQCFFKYRQIAKKGGEVKEGILTHKVNTSPDTFIRPLVEIDMGEEKKFFVVGGLIEKNERFIKKHPDGTKVKVFIPNGDGVDAYLLED